VRGDPRGACSRHRDCTPRRLIGPGAFLFLDGVVVAAGSTGTTLKLIDWPTTQREPRSGTPASAAEILRVTAARAGKENGRRELPPLAGRRRSIPLTPASPRCQAQTPYAGAPRPALVVSFKLLSRHVSSDRVIPPKQPPFLTRWHFVTGKGLLPAPGVWGAVGGRRLDTGEDAFRVATRRTLPGDRKCPNAPEILPQKRLQSKDLPKGRG